MNINPKNWNLWAAEEVAFNVLVTLIVTGICVFVFLSGHWIYHLIWP